MRIAKVLIIAGGTLLSACSAYVLPVPAGFAPGTTLPVTGASGFNQKQMTVGNYQVSIDRGSTNERSQGAGAVSDVRKRQNYSFVIKDGARTVFSGGCQRTASETSIGAPGGIEISARDKADLHCELLPQGTGRESWRLQLQGDSDNPLTGSFSGAGSSYTVQGIGTAIGSTKHGPTGGYYIRQGDRTIATVQTTGKRQVLFAPGAQSDPLLAAAVALLI